MKNKKVLIALIAVLVIVIAAVATLVIVRPFDSDKDEKEEKEKEEKVSYEDTLKKFAKACKDEDEMEKFIDKYVDYKSMYVLLNSTSYSDLEDDWKDAKKDDYTDEDFIEKVKDSYSQFVDEDLEIKISNVKENKDFDLKIKDWKMIECKVQTDDENLEYGAIFCKDKMVFISTMSAWEYLFSFTDDTDSYVYEDEEDEDDDTVKEDAEEYNQAFEDYEDYSLITGKEVLDLIDEIIDSNTKNVNEEGKFIMLTAQDEEYNAIDDDLYSICLDASIENTISNVKKANKEMEKVKYEIKTDKNYFVVKYTEYTTGYIYHIYVTEDAD